MDILAQSADNLARDPASDAEPEIERLRRLVGNSPLSHGASDWVLESFSELDRNLNLAALRCAVVIGCDGLPMATRTAYIAIAHSIGQTLEAIAKARSAWDASDWGQ